MRSLMHHTVAVVAMVFSCLPADVDAVSEYKVMEWQDLVEHIGADDCNGPYDGKYFLMCGVCVCVCWGVASVACTELIFICLHSY
jgi:hypothetical protein